MRQRLDATNLAITDILDQPESSHVLIVAEHFGARCALAVDSYVSSHQDRMVKFTRGPETICVLPTHCTWMLVARDATNTLSTRDYLEKYYKDMQTVSVYEDEMKKKYPVKEEGVIGFATQGKPVEDVLAAGYR